MFEAIGLVDRVSAAHSSITSYRLKQVARTKVQRRLVARLGVAFLAALAVPFGLALIPILPSNPSAGAEEPDLLGLDFEGDAIQADGALFAARYDRWIVSKVELGTSANTPEASPAHVAVLDCVPHSAAPIAVARPPIGQQRTIWLAGFPLRSHWCASLDTPAMRRPRGAAVAFPSMPWHLAPVALLANVLMLFVVISLPLACRLAIKANRRRHDRCGRCAHVLAGLSICPECGQSQDSA
jgi:hypothetical protein